MSDSAGRLNSLKIDAQQIPTDPVSTTAGGVANTGSLALIQAYLGRGPAPLRRPARARTCGSPRASSVHSGRNVSQQRSRASSAEATAAVCGRYTPVRRRTAQRIELRQNMSGSRRNRGGSRRAVGGHAARTCRLRNPAGGRRCGLRRGREMVTTTVDMQVGLGRISMRREPPLCHASILTALGRRGYLPKVSAGTQTITVRCRTSVRSPWRPHGGPAVAGWSAALRSIRPGRSAGVLVLHRRARADRARHHGGRSERMASRARSGVGGDRPPGKRQDRGVLVGNGCIRARREAA
jgi:hypothetical protein